jgi:uncharacterized protein (DUF305 family)
MRSTRRVATIVGLVPVAILVGIMAIAATSNRSDSRPANHGKGSTHAVARTGGALSMGGEASPGRLSNLRGPFDQNFIDNMVPNRQMAVDMARLVLKSPKRPELRRLARAVVADGTREIATLRTWRERWYGSSATPDFMALEMRGMDLRAVQRAKDRDRAFLTRMIPHHLGSIEIAREAQRSAKHPQTQALARHVVREQQAEIMKMRGWLKRWYGVTA